VDVFWTQFVALLSKWEKMKKTLITLSAVLLSVILMYGTAGAEMTGVCVDCHTMHNSQDGTDMASSPPYEGLLKEGCLSCHTGTATGTMLSSLGAPVVLHTSGTGGGTGRSYTNAGGDFYWVNNGGDALGHNVAELPDNSEDDTCAGEYGCHGTRVSGTENFTAIRGAHHGNPSGGSTRAASPTTVGESYRFLAGIKGLENADWNWNETSESHNEYYGVNDDVDRSGSANWGSRDTISFFCAECHGLFHGSIDVDTTAGSPWLRHPTDIVLPGGATEYASYNPDNGNVYSVEAPIARPVVPENSSSTVTPNDDTTENGAIVMCLSCHRAHGSDQPDLLRWAYAGMQAGTGTADTGCFVCHTTKNGD
jgi:predicted CXXCH cytochrome family protein